MKHPEHDSLHDRGRALEEAFFAERDQHLLETLRKRLTAEEAKQVLQSATGVADQIVLKELSDIQAPQFLAVLGLFPLVEVAWCDGFVEDKERQAIQAAAVDMGVEPGSSSSAFLERWLETRPKEDAINLWTDYVRAVCATLQPATVEKLKEGVMGRAKTVAAAAGGVLGFGSKISEAERRCLERLAQAFERPTSSD